ncbi:carotenoid oxygenase [Aspergillus pseudocaelatus]|uniref:Carotenoid oxygenase n=1 Tax=Aspergillus pseudocaelatus TaxID=1825620 RepID=A0ABQ6WD52_9EURO|nr:carotenoid oxygenase [Aspergillus pseudocaelatus]
MTGKENSRKHPYFSGNYAPIYTVQHAHPCEVQGTLPEEFLGGQYVRNGSNSLQDDDRRDLHWFDGDGMLSGVFFKRMPGSKVQQPLYSNRYILTDVHCATAEYPHISPILSSATTLLSPMVSPLKVFMGMLRTMALMLSSFLGFVDRPIRRISTSNTNILYHDGRALATMETGPPMRVYLPSLNTVGWFTGSSAEGEATDQIMEPSISGPGIERFHNEMTTAHPHCDYQTGELLLFHSTFIFPFVHYSIISPGWNGKHGSYLNQPVPGFTSGKMIHDFGVSRKHTIMLDIPISMDPTNITRNKPAIQYDPHGRTRFGVFPRYCPARIQWYETDSCCIFHTVNSWDESVPWGTRVHMLFPADRSSAITEQWALSAIPFEFPQVPRHLEMTAAQFVYGCSMSKGNFATRQKSSVKIDCLVKIDVQHLLQAAEVQPPTQITGCVDQRSINEILATNDVNDPIQVFALPYGWYAQECSFVPRRDGTSEDDGWLVTYVFDESQLDSNGNAPATSRSELWIIDARNMRDIVARVLLPQRVPYGMHGDWFSEEQILNQREVAEFRSLD